MIVIPAGSFLMGSADGRPDERPVHRVTLAARLAIGQREVTQGEWGACVAAGACNARPGGADRTDAPMTNLSWLDTQSYLAWLSKETGQRYRLPSEAEWEYAARGGTSGVYWWGDTVGTDHANCADCSAEPSDAVTVAGRYPSNPFGLYDTAGNAAEWVQDCWTRDYTDAPADGTAVERSGCPQRVLRGGSFVSDAPYLRSASRYRYDVAVPYYAHGFRVATEVERR
jgi:formylglycine-generating enzyme required for sulfatase activity